MKLSKGQDWKIRCSKWVIEKTANIPQNVPGFQKTNFVLLYSFIIDSNTSLKILPEFFWHVWKLEKLHKALSEYGECIKIANEAATILIHSSSLGGHKSAQKWYIIMNEILLYSQIWDTKHSWNQAKTKHKFGWSFRYGK